MTPTAPTSIERALQVEGHISIDLVRSLFKAGEDAFGGINNFSYFDYISDSKPMNLPAVQLKPVFSPLLLGLDAQNDYSLVAYTPKGKSNQPFGDREMSVCLSTVPQRRDAIGPITEITYRVNKGKQYFLELLTTLNTDLHAKWKNLTERGVRPPWASCNRNFIIENGTPKLISTVLSRTDEAVVPDENAVEQSACWERSVVIGNKGNKFDYTERYSVENQATDLPDKSKRADLNFEIIGPIDKPQEIIITLGLTSRNTPRVLYTDKSGNIEITIYQASPNCLDLLCQDPTYAFLFEAKPDPTAMLKFVKDRIQLLQEHWDKPQSIFSLANSTLNEKSTLGK